MVQGGEVHPRPASCDADVYAMITRCTRFAPLERPSFDELKVVCARIRGGSVVRGQFVAGPPGPSARPGPRSVGAFDRAKDNSVMKRDTKGLRIDGAQGGNMNLYADVLSSSLPAAGAHAGGDAAVGETRFGALSGTYLDPAHVYAAGGDAGPGINYLAVGSQRAEAMPVSPRPNAAQHPTLLSSFVSRAFPRARVECYLDRIGTDASGPSTLAHPWPEAMAKAMLGLRLHVEGHQCDVETQTPLPALPRLALPCCGRGPVPWACLQDGALGSSSGATNPADAEGGGGTAHYYPPGVSSAAHPGRL